MLQADDDEPVIIMMTPLDELAEVQPGLPLRGMQRSGGAMCSTPMTWQSRATSCLAIRYLLFRAALIASFCVFDMSQTFFVRNLQNQTTQVTLEPGLTVRQVKDSIGRTQGIEPGQIRLVFGGKELLDDAPVTDYNVGPGSNVHMALRLKGGQ